MNDKIKPKMGSDPIFAQEAPASVEEPKEEPKEKQ